ncbi:LacI family DNA-binding transcriptional regulator [Amnibacterium kyonggiense]|uniref:LacI family transcriptional regulator n=1 Tax=Amnibacterium kyonggiense TaxID=595671 RepID=A0A4R7FKF7_9MICO|nr:LacI family DNA-binding transcriptional regulator [Amnibacterium kyonggiense]TDS76827.1 LacI family transcriptional regulator [Amnibacterium kyonggiense]
MPRGRLPAAGRPRLADVARRADVSLGTVSNVFNHPELVTPDTRRRVQEAIADLGFSRNAAASVLASGDTRMIGLVVVGLSNSLFVDAARGAQRMSRADGRHLRIATAEDDHDLLMEHMVHLAGTSASGLLVAPLEEIDAAIDRVRRLDCPVVLLNFDPQRADCCRVLVDNEEVGRIAVRHMADLGRRDVLFIGGDDALQPVARRRAGVRAAAAALGTAMRLEEVDVDTWTPSTVVPVVRSLLRRDVADRPDAIVAVSDLLAIAAIEELRAGGIRVPEDIAVMGCDHNSAAWGGAVPLTSVSMEGDAMGEEGVRLLIQEIEEDPAEHMHTTVLLEPRLDARESTLGRPV